MKNHLSDFSTKNSQNKNTQRILLRIPSQIRLKFITRKQQATHIYKCAFCVLTRSIEKIGKFHDLPSYNKAHQ